MKFWKYFPIPFLGSKYKELQITEVANLTELPQPASTPFNGHSSPEQLDGTMVSHAFPDAEHLPVTPGLQRMVFKPADGNDWRKQRVQWRTGQTFTFSMFNFLSKFDENFVSVPEKCNLNQWCNFSVFTRKSENSISLCSAKVVSAK